MTGLSPRVSHPCGDDESAGRRGSPPAGHRAGARDCAARAWRSTSRSTAATRSRTWRSTATTSSCSTVTSPSCTATRCAGRCVADGGHTRVLMLTAASTIRDRVEGLELGADDYLGKPFEFAELVARVRALARRAVPPLPPVLVHDDLSLDPSRHVAFRGERRLELSPKEFALLECLLAADGRVLSAEELLARVWDEAANPFTTTVKTTMGRLRSEARRPAADRDRARERLPDLMALRLPTPAARAQRTAAAHAALQRHVPAARHDHHRHHLSCSPRSAPWSTSPAPWISEADHAVGRRPRARSWSPTSSTSSASADLRAGC